MTTGAFARPQRKLSVLNVSIEDTASYSPDREEEDVLRFCRGMQR